VPTSPLEEVPPFAPAILPPVPPIPPAPLVIPPFPPVKYAPL